jgi:hypothetical protein
MAARIGFEIVAALGYRATAQHSVGASLTPEQDLLDASACTEGLPWLLCKIPVSTAPGCLGTTHPPISTSCACLMRDAALCVPLLRACALLGPGR